jgi:hypothetical protein
VKICPYKIKSISYDTGHVLTKRRMLVTIFSGIHYSADANDELM